MKMMRKRYAPVGRCHPWCGNREILIGFRAFEKREAQAEIAMEQAIHADDVEEFYRLDAL